MYQGGFAALDIFAPTFDISPTLSVINDMDNFIQQLHIWTRGRLHLDRFEALPGHVNLGHGRMIECSDEADHPGEEVSFVVAPSCVSALALKGHLDYLSRQARNIATMWELVELPNHIPVLVTKIISVTFGEWVIRPNVTLKMKKNFFREMFCTVWSIHKAGSYFGNLTEGVRVREDNTPIFVFPAILLAHQRFLGRWEDLRQLREMVNVALPNSYERASFNRICDQYINVFEPHTLRVASFSITHAPLVYDDRDRYNLIRKMSEFRSRNTRGYDTFVCDISPGNPRIPGPDWQDLVENDPDIPGQVYRFHRRVVSVGNKSRRVPYLTSESVRTLHRSSYEHPRSAGSHMMVSRMLYRRLPCACADLYEYILIGTLFPHSDMVDFLQSEPASLNFY